MAKAASDRSRPACDQAVSSCAAQITPTPGSASSRGASLSTRVSSSLWSSSASAWRASARWAVRRSPMIVARCSIGWVEWLRRRAQRASSWSVASARSCSRRRWGALTTSALRWLIAHVRAPIALWRVVSSTRIASRSPRRRGWARWSRPSASRAARTASRSSVLAVAARRAGRTVDLDDPFALLEQVGGEAGAVAAGALDRPDPTSWRLLDCEPVAAAVAGGVGGDALVRDDRTSRADQGNGVAVFVGVDADDVVDLVCQHGWRCLLRGVALVSAGPGEGDRAAGL